MSEFDLRTTSDILVCGLVGAEFYTCRECGACILEINRQDSARTVHTGWHSHTVLHDTRDTS